MATGDSMVGAPSGRLSCASRAAPVPRASERSDADLVRSIGRGDHEALAEAYVRHSSKVYGLAVRICGRARAEDVLQDAFLRLWTHPNSYDPERGSLGSFLLLVAHSRAVDVLRSDGSRRVRETADLGVGPAPDAAADVGALTAIGSVEIKRALAALPAPERQAIAMAYFGGHTYRDVARLLGEADGTIKSRIRRGLSRLQAQLASPAG